MEFDQKIKATPEIARIHAHACGDGSVYIRNSKRSPGTLLKHKRRNIYRKEWVIEYYNNEPELVKEFVSDFKISFNRNKKTLRNKIKFIGAKHIAEKLELTGKNSYNWYIPNFIMNASNKIRSNWLRAFFDDEGYFSGSAINLTVVNKKGITQIQHLLSSLSIQSNLHGPYFQKNPKHHPFYRISILRENIIAFWKYVNFLHPIKKKRLKELVKKWGCGNIHSEALNSSQL